MPRPPDELGKPTAGTIGFRHKHSLSFPKYQPRHRTASASHLRLVHDSSGLAARTLERACREVRELPVRLPLWSFRLGQIMLHDGRLQYRDVWDRLYRAAWDGGARDGWIRRAIFNGFSAAQTSDVPTIKLAQLQAEGCQ